MKKTRRKDTVSSITFGLLLFGGMFAHAQSSTTQDACRVVHDAYKKTFRAGSNMSTNNSGAVNVTKAQGDITGDGQYKESCNYLRDENLNGEMASIYSEVMKSGVGIANGKIWISKTRGLVLQQEVEVDMGAKGNGKQTIVFAYKK